MTTWNDILNWASKSTRPAGECQGFVGNDFTSVFGNFRKGYNSAKDAMNASKALDKFHTDDPPNGRVVWVWYEFPTYGHNGLAYNGVVLSNSTHCSVFLNKKRTVGTFKLHDYPTKYLGWSEVNGINTIPQLPSKPRSKDDVKKVAEYLNNRKLGKTSTAVIDGIPGTILYWLIQTAGKKDGIYTGIIDGIIGPKTEKTFDYYISKLHNTKPPVEVPPVEVPPVEVPPIEVPPKEIVLTEPTPYTIPLGTIVTNSVARKIIYGVYALSALIVGGIVVYFFSIHEELPTVFVGIQGVIAYFGIPIGALAIANTPPKISSKDGDTPNFS